MPGKKDKILFFYKSTPSYIKKIFKNGKWVYFYKDMDSLQAAKKKYPETIKRIDYTLITDDIKSKIKDFEEWLRSSNIQFVTERKLTYEENNGYNYRQTDKNKKLLGSEKRKEKNQKIKRNIMQKVFELKDYYDNNELGRKMSEKSVKELYNKFVKVVKEKGIKDV